MMSCDRLNAALGLVTVTMTPVRPRRSLAAATSETMDLISSPSRKGSGDKTLDRFVISTQITMLFVILTDK